MFRYERNLNGTTSQIEGGDRFCSCFVQIICNEGWKKDVSSHNSKVHAIIIWFSKLLRRYLPRRKFTVNHEYNPSSWPSIMVTASSTARNGLELIISRTWIRIRNTLSWGSLRWQNRSKHSQIPTASSRASAFSEGNNRNPAVARTATGVFAQSSWAMNSLAFSNNSAIFSAPYDRKFVRPLCSSRI